MTTKEFDARLSATWWGNRCRWYLNHADHITDPLAWWCAVYASTAGRIALQ